MNYSIKSLEEFKNEIDSVYDNVKKHSNPKEIQILITTSENTVGARSCCKIDGVSIGFDFESGQVRIEPSIPLLKEKNSRLIAKSPIQKTLNNKKYYVCSSCLLKISKSDIFCKHCGQKLK